MVLPIRVVKLCATCRGFLCLPLADSHFSEFPMTRISTELAPSARSETLVLGLYTASVFLSALLLFGVQPMFARMVLPQLGGSPSVWSVAMVFFQSMLFAGYAHAHVLTSLCNKYAAVGIHLVLMLIAALTLPLAIARGWGNPPVTAIAPYWLLVLFV